MRGTLVKHTRAFMKNEGRRKRGVYLIPNLLTTGNLFSGLFSILAVFNANYMNAAIAILVAVVFDMLDGKSARWTNSTSQFGVEYDSLADLVSFGVAPGLLIYSWALSGYGMMGSAVMFAFVACGALRLARFNVMSTTSESKYFTGLPIPAAASVIATAVVFDHYIVRMGAEVKPLLILMMTMTLAFLMVSTVKYPTFKSLGLRSTSTFSKALGAALFLGLILVFREKILYYLLPAFFTLYLIYGFIRPRISRRMRHEIEEEEDEEELP